MKNKDQINRQEAIDALSTPHGILYPIRTIESLPSAQPEPCDDVVSRADVELEIANILRHVFVEYQDIAKKAAAKLPSAQPEQRWVPCSEEPDTNRNVFIARGRPDFMTVCIGYYDDNHKQWYENRNWFACCIYDGLYWCEIPPLPEPYKDDPCNECGYLGESCVGEGCGKLTERKEGKAE